MQLQSEEATSKVHGITQTARDLPCWQPALPLQALEASPPCKPGGRSAATWPGACEKAGVRRCPPPSRNPHQLSPWQEASGRLLAAAHNVAGSHLAPWLTSPSSRPVA
jgi:hypothetical protein